ncbi:hypothetical protein D9M69_612070 [compost metagenome]
MLESRQRRLAHAVGVQVDLDAATRRAERRVLQRGKTGLAHHALEHHAARHAGARRRGLQRLLAHFAIGREQGLGLVDRLEVIREGHALAFLLGRTQRLEFLAALRNQLVVVGSRGGLGVVGGHGVGAIKNGLRPEKRNPSL